MISELPTANGQQQTERSDTQRQTAAQRQARHRAKTEVLRNAVAQLREKFEQAADAAGMSAIADRLPDEPTACLLEISRRLEGARMFVMPLRPDAETARPRKPKPGQALLKALRKEYNLDADQAREALAAALRNHQIRAAILGHVTASLEGSTR